MLIESKKMGVMIFWCLAGFGLGPTKLFYMPQTLAKDKKIQF